LHKFYQFLKLYFQSIGSFLYRKIQTKTNTKQEKTNLSRFILIFRLLKMAIVQQGEKLHDYQEFQFLVDFW
jgi:hypothetical protein